MADAKIDFNDGTSATLQSPVPAPGNRFHGWTPDIDPVAHREVALGTGATSQFLFRTDYLARFEIRNLRPAQHAVALRLKAHLLNGGSCTVTTADAGGTTYTCTIAPGSVPELVFTDERMVEFTMRLALKNASAAAMICSY